MTGPRTAAAIDRSRPMPQIDGLVRSIAIPPRPALLVKLQEEVGRDEPDSRRIAAIVGKDVALTAAVLRSVNSPFFGLSRRAETVDQAVSLLGLRQIGALVTGLVLRQVLRQPGVDLSAFWTVSQRRAFALTQLASGLRGVASELAHSFGLFCDVGVPLLMPRFADYVSVLDDAARATDRPCTAIEQATYKTDHALVGSLMARTWGLSPLVSQAIRHHHEPAALVHPETPDTVSRLVAMNLLAERALQHHAGTGGNAEWAKGGAAASDALGLAADEVDGWTLRLSEGFSLVD